VRLVHQVELVHLVQQVMCPVDRNLLADGTRPDDVSAGKKGAGCRRAGGEYVWAPAPAGTTPPPPSTNLGDLGT
jgi:hypothetical protein